MRQASDTIKSDKVKTCKRAKTLLTNQIIKNKRREWKIYSIRCL